MKSLSDIPPLPDEIFEDRSSFVPTETTDNKAPKDKDTPKKSQRRGAEADLGAFDGEKYLQHYGWYKTTKKNEKGGTNYVLTHCVFDESHKGKDASISVGADKVIRYQCFHNSCKGRTFQEARAIISGEDSLAPFHANYDPDWKPKKTKETPTEAMPPPDPSTPRPFLVMSEKGKRATFIPRFLADDIMEKYKPLFSEGTEVGEMIYHYDEEHGVWKYLPDGVLRRYAMEKLGEHGIPMRVSNVLGMVKDLNFIRAGDMQFNPMWLNFKNCMYNVESGETAKHDAKYFSRTQLPVNYDPDSKFTEWEDRLVEIFADDPEKIRVLQQFFGYCLYPKIIFPCALFQIGQGRNGKGLVEGVLCAMLGKDNVSHISLQRMAEKFGPIEMKDKLLNACGETETGKLDVTNFKKIAAGDEIQAEVKYHGDVTFKPIAKHLISMNAFPRITEKTDAFFRRVIVIEYKQKFEGKDDDKRLGDKLLLKLDSILNWSIQGLKIVLENDEIVVPPSVDRSKERFREKVNPVLMFVREECTMGNGARILPKDLYKAYADEKSGWCADAKIRPLGKQNFYEQVLTNFPEVTKRRDPSGTKEYFYGIELTSDDGQTSY